MLTSKCVDALKQAGVTGRQIVEILSRDDTVRIVLDSGQVIVFFMNAEGPGIFVDDEGWLAERLRVEEIVAGCSPLAQRLFSLIADIITISPEKLCFVSFVALARTLRAQLKPAGLAKEELIKAGVLISQYALDERKTKLLAFSIPCRTRSLNPAEPRETIPELLQRVWQENETFSRACPDSLSGTFSLTTIWREETAEPDYDEPIRPRIEED